MPDLWHALGPLAWPFVSMMVLLVAWLSLEFYHGEDPFALLRRENY